MSVTNQENKSCCWSITINNPTDDDLQQWESLKHAHFVREAVGQMEKGENGTPHLQGMVKTTSVRFSQMKRALTRAHIEAARSAAALAKYVVKEETRVSTIPTTKVATQADVQKTILNLTLTRYLELGNENNKELFYAWLRNIKYSKLLKLEDQIFSVDYWIDTAVNNLIVEGFYGIEFVMSNPQVRSAFKNYFAAIIIRQYGASQATQDQGPQDQASS